MDQETHLLLLSNQVIGFELQQCTDMLVLISSDSIAHLFIMVFKGNNV